MTKRVKISELKAHLSAYLRHVRKGHTVEVLDRESPVARLVPLEERSSGLTVRPAAGRFRDLKLPRRRWRTRADVVALIREDRDAR
jgi:prevent-host-death family protein